ncbi:hypothetical protein DFR58_1604 [Anaerobacterium chartisolvens]|uniref:Uncharacterized protein n=1 Tax=Anaerobacterium chartisolvens TaxID=1297424 RepID=A0A369AD38_9FIRM|nr:hypothetical protein DFR58_1604 [Anaerobacterium chartisolvens]
MLFPTEFINTAVSKQINRYVVVQKSRAHIALLFAFDSRYMNKGEFS